MLSKWTVVSYAPDESIGGPKQWIRGNEIVDALLGHRKPILRQSDLDDGVNGWKIDENGEIQKTRGQIGEEAYKVLHRDILLIDNPVQGVVEGFQKFIQNPNTSIPLNTEEFVDIFRNNYTYGLNLLTLFQAEKITEVDFKTLFNSLLDSYLRKILKRIHTPAKITDRGVGTGITIDTGKTHLWGEHDLPEFHIEILKWGLTKGKIQDADIPAGHRFKDLREDMKKERLAPPLTGLYWEVITLS